MVLSAHYACTHCGLSFESPSPQLFSFNSPQGMCTKCDGLGRDLRFRCRPHGARSEADVQGRLLRVDRAMEGNGPLAAAYLPRRGRHDRAASRLAARHDARNAVEQAAGRVAEPVALGHRRRSTSRSPGATARTAKNTAASSRASCRNCCRATARRKAASSGGSWKST